MLFDGLCVLVVVCWLVCVVHCLLLLFVAFCVLYPFFFKKLVLRYLFLLVIVC